MNKIVQQEAAKGVKLFPVTENLLVQVSEFKGKKRVDIRKWFKGENTEEFFRSKKGLNITTEEWDDFAAQVGDIDKFVREQT